MRRSLLTPLLLLLLPALAQAFTLRLDWTYVQNPQAPAVGFHVWRQLDCAGQWGKLTAAPLALAALTYTDTTFALNTTYCWEVTAVDGLGMESAPSNTVQFRVSPPAPPGPLRGTLVP